MEVAETSYRNVPLLTIEGDIDHDSASRLAALIDKALAGRASRTVLLDLKNVLFIDSGGFSVLLHLLASLGHDDWMGIINPRPVVLRLLDTAGVTCAGTVKIFATLEEAGREMTAPPR